VTKSCTYSSDQFFGGERLADIIFGPEVKTASNLARISLDRENYHRHLRKHFSQLSEHALSMHSRQMEVK
jgi:hypothetical protein